MAPARSSHSSSYTTIYSLILQKRQIEVIPVLGKPKPLVQTILARFYAWDQNKDSSEQLTMTWLPEELFQCQSFSKRYERKELIGQQVLAQLIASLGFPILGEKVKLSQANYNIHRRREQCPPLPERWTLQAQLLNSFDYACQFPRWS